MRLEIFAEKIFYFTNTGLDGNNIIQIINSFDPCLADGEAITKWVPWRASTGSLIYGKQKQFNKNLLDTSSENTKNIYKQIESIIQEIGKIYSSKLKIDIGENGQISISQYVAGAEMGPHFDAQDVTVEEENKPSVTSIIYLNDDYIGGELCFPDYGIKIKPAAGSIVVFPSTKPFIHQSLKIESGKKYMCQTFWQV
jgi:predicted 2-oxoglutarate/Fe(II)-dependent dioxygenase YbiX